MNSITIGLILLALITVLTRFVRFMLDEEGDNTINLADWKRPVHTNESMRQHTRRGRRIISGVI